MHVGLHRTPLGRLALALRDNEHRVRFLGFNTHVARTLIFAISCLFTGVAGALLAIANEATNYTIFSAQASANVVLQTFIGGSGTFFGPALGAPDDVLRPRNIRPDALVAALPGPDLRSCHAVRTATASAALSRACPRLRAGGWKHLAPPISLPPVGLLLVAGVVFVVESIHVVLSDAYLGEANARQAAHVFPIAIRPRVRPLLP